MTDRTIPVSVIDATTTVGVVRIGTDKTDWHPNPAAKVGIAPLIVTTPTITLVVAFHPDADPSGITARDDMRKAAHTLLDAANRRASEDTDA